LYFNQREFGLSVPKSKAKTAKASLREAFAVLALRKGSLRAHFLRATFKLN
jgi:hypothetical protein